MRHSDMVRRRIRSLREAKGYSQEYMAEMLGISQSTYANLEAGKSSMSVDRFFHIASILETDFAALMEYPEKDHQPNAMITPPHSLSLPPQEAELTVYQQLVSELQKEIEFLKTIIRNGWTNGH